MKNKSVPTSSAVGAPILKKKSANSICYVAGRSGGHILPALTQACLHHEQYPDAQRMFITTDSMLDVDLLAKAPQIKTKLHLKLPNVPSGVRHAHRVPLFAWRLGVAFIQSLRALRQKKVTHVISMGGYISLPACLAARCLRIPITLFELNANPGKATLFLAPYVTNVAICFTTAKAFFKRPVTCLPYPIQYKQIPTAQELAEHKQQQGILPGKKIVVVLGGSQGSVFLNTLIGRWLEQVSGSWHHLHLVHQTGSNDTFNWQQWYQEQGIAATVFSYNNNLAPWYACADLVICRAGAGTLFEVAFFQKKAIVIPLVTQQTAHQVDNAKAMVQQYPELFFMLNQDAIERDPRLFFELMQNKLD